MDISNFTSKIAPDALQPKLTNPFTDAASETSSEGTPADVMNSFGQVFSSTMKHVNALQQSADSLVQDYATGGSTPLHQVMIATETSDTALQLTMQLRNKIMSAYTEIAHMSV